MTDPSYDTRVLLGELAAQCRELVSVVKGINGRLSIIERMILESRSLTTEEYWQELKKHGLTRGSDE